MKKKMKKVLAYVLTVAMVCSLGMAIPKTAETVKADTNVYWSWSKDFIASYQPTDSGNKYTRIIDITGCDKKSEIKNLKSSNKSICTVKPDEGRIIVTYGKKAGKSIISCTVKGVKLREEFTVKKYSNPLSSFKIGTAEYVSKYKVKDTYRLNKPVKKKTLSVKAKKGWRIISVSINPGNGAYYSHEVFKNSFSKKINLPTKKAYVCVFLRHKSTGLEEILMFTRYTL